MVAIKNCPRCGRLFAGVEDVCPSCLAKEHEEFEKVRSYLAEHRNASVTEVSGETGVAVAQIHRWVRAGRLKLTSEQLGDTLRCERCGAPIERGRFCPTCLGELAREIRRAAAGPPAEGPATAPLRPPKEAAGKEGKRPRVHTKEDIERRFG